MVGPIRGRLLSPVFARTVLPTLPGASTPSPEADRQLERIGEIADEAFGPASGTRTIADVLAVPLIRALGLRVLHRRDGPEEVRFGLGGSGPVVISLLVRGWADDLDLSWRDIVRDGIATDAQWCLALNGRALRFINTQRTWSRDYVELDLPALTHDADVRRLAWMLGNAEALTSVPALLDTATRLSAAHGTEVCRALGDGVVKALASLFEALLTGSPRRLSASTLLEQCLTVIYRILFLLFAEARGLVPVWHPIYKDHYTVGAIVSALLGGRSSRGTWPAIQAISRMVHAGCTAGTLSVTAFNGRLFAPAQTAAIEQRRIADSVMEAVVMELGTTTIARSGRVRTRYEELDVEQLGSIYEHVLEYQPASQQDSGLVRTRDARKASGTFYTPREIARSLVERTLEPLTSGRTAEQILRVRILDPAMGSGAFLVAACRYLARRAEESLIADGRWHRAEVTDLDRTILKREIVQRCLYGVDLNPIAAQLARLSLWLVSLARDKPLSFLDHHLVVGNSLVGASPSDLYRPTGGNRHTGPRRREVSLFDDEQLGTTLVAARQVREALALEPDDNAGLVRSKEQRLASLGKEDTPLGAWKRALDLWCSSWFWDDDFPPNRATLTDIASGLLSGRSCLGARTTEHVLARSDRCAEREKFLHWTLAFPEVFHPASGESTGFDAILGNPPWDMIRGDSGDREARGVRRDAARSLTTFVRNSGIYMSDARSHLNRYALFVERALQLVRHSGRIGLVLPAGVLTDAGAAPLRMHLMSAAAVEDVIGLENRAGIFPIHRSVKFVLLSATAGAATQAIRCRFGISRLADLDRQPSSDTLIVTRTMLDRVSGPDDLALPELGSARDLRILEAISNNAPTLVDERGWRVRFGRELNASDDRLLMVPASTRPGGRPVIEGKVISPFRVSLKDCRLELKEGAVLKHTITRRARLAYREVASATNRLTLIAAIVPAHAVTTHTVFCLKTPLPLDAQRVLCALLNSFVANYLVRMRVGTHVTAAIMSRLRVPLVAPGSRPFARLLALSNALSEGGGDVERTPAFAELQALAAMVYGLGEDDFAHVLGTFPLIPHEIRAACERAFGDAGTPGR